MIHSSTPIISFGVLCTHHHSRDGRLRYLDSPPTTCPMSPKRSLHPSPSYSFYARWSRSRNDRPCQYSVVLLSPHFGHLASTHSERGRDRALVEREKTWWMWLTREAYQGTGPDVIRTGKSSERELLRICQYQDFESSASTNTS